MSTSKRGRLLSIVVVLLASVVAGCDRTQDSGSDRSTPVASRTKADVPLGPRSSPVEPTLDKGWCGGHGVPESVCTRCDASLVPRFKQAGDWCAEHELPESQCTVCHPEVAARWRELNPNEPSNGPAPSTPVQAPERAFGPLTSPVSPTLDQGWCTGHGVPESVCTRCNSDLIPTFQAAGDWCAEHGLPETQCPVCHPEVTTEWHKLNPAAAPEDRRGDAQTVDEPSPTETRSSGAPDADDVRVERADRRLTGANDPLCPVEDVRVRFIDRSILAKAGIRVERAQRRPVTATRVVPAEVEYDATRVNRIAARLSGVAIDVPVNLGDVVEVGDVLTVLDCPVLGEAKHEYIERSQAVKLAQKDAGRADAILNGVKRMIEVCTPQADPELVRDTLATATIGHAKSQLLRAHATLWLARSEAVRASALHDRKLSSERDVQSAQSSLIAAEAEFDAIREEIAFAADRTRVAARGVVETAAAALRSSIRRLHILGLDDAEIDAIGTAPEVSLARLELRSPRAGYVVEHGVTVGEYVNGTDELFTIVDTSSVWLTGDVFERDVSLLRLGQRVLFKGDGLAGTSEGGRITWISPSLDERTRTLRFRASLPNPNGRLREHTFGEARIVIHEDENVVTVPAQAIQTDGCCQLVFVQESDTVFRPRKLVLGAASGDFVEVIHGLAENEVVASAGSFLMKTEILKGSIGAGCCDVDPGR